MNESGHNHDAQAPTSRLKKVALTLTVVAFALGFATTSLGMDFLNRQPWLTLRWILAACVVVTLSVFLFVFIRDRRSR